VEELEKLRDRPKRKETPYIYHLDVGAMYPNIILSNRLQPGAIVDDATCAACDFNQSKNNCKRRMPWIWRGDYNPATKMEYDRTKDQLSREVFQDGVPFSQLPESEQAALVASRLKTYANKAYKKTKITEEKLREDVVCMRENDFYVDTVRQFRDRRYEYKALKKTWSKKSENATDPATKKECEDRLLVYDSLQVAHKCILNSFYGYVMRKGARWRSMEMAGIVTKNGADIITQARRLVEQIGRPLELDTDGIWCILPGSFPDVYSFLAEDGSKLKLEYPCVMLNAACQDEFTNHQYQVLVDPERGIYETRSECSIFFEVDGPYRCMVLPASTEEGKLLKKRYAVFNFDGSLAELKGFELKRRGELELIKTFQSQVFERFLDGGSLKECYDSVADVANHWIDVIETRGENLDEDELVDLISENRNMSRQLEDYGGQKGTSQTTARRLAEFLGAELIRDKGLNCKFIISEQPYGAPVTERAVPTAIWKASPNVTQRYLRKWLKSPGLEGDALDIRNVLDWDYYLDRLGKTIQKIITIPAALQNIPNPVPRLEHPAWLGSKVNQMNDKNKQQSIAGMLVKRPERSALVDIEDIATNGGNPKLPVVHKRVRNGLSRERDDDAPPEKRVELSKENFDVWLKQKKASWRKGRKERRSQRSSSNDGDAEKRAKTATSMEGYIREAALSKARREWQIVEVREMTSYDSLSSGSGEFVVWAMVGTDSLQKIIVSVPRTVYISSRTELTYSSNDITHFRRVERHLPHCKAAQFLYEVSLPEHVYKKKTWVDCLYPIDPSVEKGHAIESVYQSKSPSMLRLLSELGHAVRLESSQDAINKKSYTIEDFKRVGKLSGGDYLNAQLSYRRLFLYVRINSSLKTGLIALFDLKGGSGALGKETKNGDITRPTDAGQGNFDISSFCNLWIVKPGSGRKAQRNVSLKECKNMFKELVESIQNSAGLDSDYSCIFPESHIEVSNLYFVDNEDQALAGANELISSAVKSSTGPAFLLLNSSKEQRQLRRIMTSFNSCPVLSMPFPPGPAHNPAIASLPALNWEQPLIQLSLEAYLFMVVISFPKRVSYARYGQIPLGNLGTDENITLFDAGMTRLLQKNSALSWASSIPGKPDLGENFLPSFNGGTFAQNESGTVLYSLDDAWEDEDDLISPTIRRPGVYRSVCVDIDVQDFAIAALSDMSVAIASIGPGVVQQDSTIGQKPESPTSVAALQESFQATKATGPLGDEMSTSISLSIIRSMVSNWLRDAFHDGSLVADELLHHIYRLISDPNTLLHDPALHRVVHALMKSTFLRVLGELQRLGCAIIYASFNRITVATNKIDLADAEEYVDFVINTAKNKSEEGSVLSKVSLRPKQFHTHYIFLNEFNFGTIHLERVPADEMEPDAEVVFVENGGSHAIVPSVVTGWSLTNYLGSHLAQEYFKAIIARFSRDVLKKQMELHAHGNSGSSSLLTGDCNELSAFQKSLVERHFSSYLTRAVDEIMKEGPDDEIPPPLVNDDTTRSNMPALEFVKNLIAVLELDPETTKEVHSLKRSLLAQVDIPEYARVAQWKDPCPTLILPDVFCSECQDSRDVNLCYVPPRDEEEDTWNHEWACEDCGTPYDVVAMEHRLVHMLQKKVMRYQLQDLRVRKTRRVSTWALRSDDCETDIPSDQTMNELKLVRNLAELHQLETLNEITTGLLESFEA
jgi:DNA polymerase epsilon subunit 1